MLNPLNRWTPLFKHEVWSSRVKSTTALVDAITQASQVESFINITGTQHYRPNDSQVYKETDRVEEFDYMSSLCMDWEKAADMPENRTCRGVCYFFFFQTAFIKNITFRLKFAVVFVWVVREVS